MGASFRPLSCAGITDLASAETPSWDSSPAERWKRTNRFFWDFGCFSQTWENVHSLRLLFNYSNQGSQTVRWSTKHAKCNLSDLNCCEAQAGWGFALASVKSKEAGLSTCWETFDFCLYCSDIPHSHVSLARVGWGGLGRRLPSQWQKYLLKRSKGTGGTEEEKLVPECQIWKQ